ncbi:MAG: synthase, large subunit, partial [Thermomicrobiales bacterium]|nr:synthase, large subunit [Thermomicrobiales bacterium]
MKVSEPRTNGPTADELRVEGGFDTVVVLDFGSQYSQLIARRVREAGVYSILLPWDTPWEEVSRLQPKGIILSGGPASVYDQGAPSLPAWVLGEDVPVLGICYGMQLIASALDGGVESATRREYGPATVELTQPSPLFRDLPASLDVWMSHGDHVTRLPTGYIEIARSNNAPIAGMTDGRRFGIQFHPEVAHTALGRDLLRNFLVDVCNCRTDWTAEHFIDSAVRQIQETVGDGRVLLGLSGGVDSSVAAALIHRAIEDRLTPVFVDNGLLRLGEANLVRDVFGRAFGMNLVFVDASERFLSRLEGVADPEEKRKIVGDEFIRTFEAQAALHGPFDFLAQGTLYPDVIESTAPDTKSAIKIKTHHNVGGLPADLTFALVEPLRFLFKDEVRDVGRALGLPSEIVDRQPFPGPGLAVRIIGDVTRDDLELLRQADAVVREEIEELGGSAQVWQFFAVLLPVRTVGVMGDYRTYGRV